MTRKMILLAVAAVSGMAAQESLPRAETILERYIEVTGGRAAYEALRSEIRTSVMEIAGKGMRFTMTTYRAAPDKSYTVMEMPGIGTVREGTDGEVVWSLSTIRGPLVKEGPEKQLGLLSAQFNSDLRWRDLFKSAETTAVEAVDGDACYVLAMESKEGIKQTRYYSRESGLLRKTSMVLKLDAGEIPMESVVSDYRKVGGILVPHKAATKMLGNDLLITIESVKPNAEIDLARFELPPEIKAVLAKRK